MPCLRVDRECGGEDGGWQGHAAADGPDQEDRNNGDQLTGLLGQGGHDGPPPVQGDGQHGEHAGRDRGEGDELSQGAEQGAKVPNSEQGGKEEECMFLNYQKLPITYDVPISHVDEGEDAVEGRHEDVRHGQVQQEIVGHTPHAAVSCNINNMRK